jgi:hypothetical protein
MGRWEEGLRAVLNCITLVNCGGARLGGCARLGGGPKRLNAQPRVAQRAEWPKNLRAFEISLISDQIKPLREILESDVLLIMRALMSRLSFHLWRATQIPPFSG